MKWLAKGHSAAMNMHTTEEELLGGACLNVKATYGSHYGQETFGMEVSDRMPITDGSYQATSI
jgi:hypothetical protein